MKNIKKYCLKPNHPSSILNKHKDVSYLGLTRSDFSDLSEDGKKNLIKFVKLHIPEAEFKNNELMLPDYAIMLETPSFMFGSVFLAGSPLIATIYYISEKEQTIDIFKPLETDLKDEKELDILERIKVNKDLMTVFSEVYWEKNDKINIKVLLRDEFEELNTDFIKKYPDLSAYGLPVLVNFTPPEEWKEENINLLLVGQYRGNIDCVPNMKLPEYKVLYIDNLL